MTVNSDDPDIERATETFAALTAEALPYGLWPLIEPIVYTEVSNLDEALQIAERSDGGGILLDTLPSTATAAGSNGYARLTRIFCPTYNSAMRPWNRPANCRVPVGCPAGNPRTAPTCSWRAGPCACCRETANCRWRSLSPRSRKESPSAS